MNPFLIMLAVVLLGVSTNAGWFDHNSEREHQTEQHIRDLQTQVIQQQEQIDQWRNATFTLGVGCVVILVIGTAIGSKARKEVRDEQT